MKSKMVEKIARGNLDAIILSELAKGPIYGYGLILRIKKRLQVYFGPSTIYPILLKMQRDGIVESRWDTQAGQRPRKLYVLTGFGQIEKQNVVRTTEMILAPMMEV